MLVVLRQPRVGSVTGRCFYRFMPVEPGPAIAIDAIGMIASI